MSKEKPQPQVRENIQSIWGACNIEYHVLKGIEQYQSGGQIHHPEPGNMFFAVNAKCKRLRDGQYLQPETLLQNSLIGIEDKTGKRYLPCASNIDNEKWSYWLFEIPVKEFPPKFIVFILPQGNA
jgi:hypothetical protein